MNGIEKGFCASMILESILENMDIDEDVYNAIQKFAMCGLITIEELALLLSLCVCEAPEHIIEQQFQSILGKIK